MEKKFTIIKGPEIYSYIRNHASEVKRVIKAAYQAYGKGEAENPGSFFLRFSDQPKTRIIGLPATLKEDSPITGIKWIGSNPDNVSNGFPRASATIILNDYITKYPIACMEGATISAARTAYSACLVAEYLWPSEQSVNLGIVGTSTIAQNTLQSIVDSGLSFEKINLYDLNPTAANHFIDQCTQALNIDKSCFNIITSLQECISSSSVIVFATSALEPYLTDQNLLSHNPLILHISLRDISPEILLQSNNIVDDIDHVLTANTSPHLASIASDSREFINGDINDLLNGKLSLPSDKPTIFSPMGMGILDIAVARLIYQELSESEDVVHISDFFNEC